jgi:hypothetical protein
VAEDDTEQLRVEQIRREREARKRAASADDPTEEHTEERRAERAAYLREKLGERAESEERVGQDP